MSASRHLQPLQFNISEDPSGEYHHLEATHPEHGLVGTLTWAKSAKNRGAHQRGEIANIQVNEPHRRQGVATSMYYHALDSGVKPAPKHSQNLSPLYPGRPDIGGGEAWANYVGGESVKPRKPKPGRDIGA